MSRYARVVSALVTFLMPAAVFAQGTPAASQPGRVTLPTVVVTAQKEPEDIQKLPISVTAVTKEGIADAGVRIISDATTHVPNTFYTEFTARKLSTARFRGIGGSPANPGITTYVDGVPQLNTNTSSIDLLAVERIEFVRGPQSALFGRNTLGGLVNVVTERPSLTGWTASVTAPFGNYGAKQIIGAVSGPLGSKVAVGVSVGHAEREGFTTNVITGNDLDRRSGTTFKAQALFTPTAKWEARVIVSGERARDGDYALNDLGSLRTSPFQAFRDFEGRTDRDVINTTVLTRYEGARLALTTTTGIVDWKTQDLTDLDYTPLSLVRRDNTEEALQFTQEVRLASAAAAPVRLGGAVLKWQTGVFFFTQNYEQDAINSYAPFLLSPLIPFGINQHSPQGTLDDAGVGVYGQGTFTLRDSFDVSVGARVDHEQKDAALRSFFVTLAPLPSVTVEADESFTSVSPQFAAAYRFRPASSAYVSVSRGFKAGGFNPNRPVIATAYGEEHTWNTEGGVKTSWADGRVLANVAIFHVSWDDMQLNLPDLSAPGQFFIANVGNASSSGVEVEVTGRAHPSVDLFATLGFTRARFGDGAFSSGLDVSGNDLPNTPEYTASFGADVNRAINSTVTVYGRAEAVFYGAFSYDDLNREGQDAYSLTNLRAGARGRYLFAEAWVRNAFDERYIPLAFAYGPFAPSGYVGEMGRPRTFGVSAGVTF
jgi:iron complex outermembrane recepter protein